MLAPLRSAPTIATTLATVRRALFPRNSSAPAPGAPMASNPVEEKPRTTAQARREAAVALLNLLPRAAAMALFGPVDVAMEPDSEDASQKRRHGEDMALVTVVEQTVLAPFGNAYMNRHLVFSVLERVLVAVCPELGDGGGSIASLLEERGVAAATR